MGPEVFWFQIWEYFHMHNEIAWGWDRSPNKIHLYFIYTLYTLPRHIFLVVVLGFELLPGTCQAGTLPFEPQPVLLSFIFWGRVSCFFPGWDYRHAQPPKVILYTIFVHLGVLTGTHLWGQTWNFPFIASCQHSKVWNFGVFGIFRLEMLNMYLIEIFFVCVCAAGDGTQGMEHGRQVLNHWTIPTALTGIFLMINEIDVYKTLRTVPGTHQLSYNILLHFFFCVVNWGLSSGLCTCKAGAFLFESHRQSTFLWLFWRWSLTNCLPRLASSYDPLALGHPCS
jgi:hypothetical protein